VPAPISAPGPITASGSIVTPASIRAQACTLALPARPLTPNSDDGRNAPGNSARATVTKARYGSAVTSTASVSGAASSNCGFSRQAPARVTAN